MQALLLFFSLFVVDFQECLYILDVGPLSVTCIEEITPFCAWHFHFLF